MTKQSCRANLLKALCVYLTIAAALCTELEAVNTLLDQKMSAAKKCSVGLGFDGWPEHNVETFHLITEIYMLGTAKNNQDFVAT